MAWFLLKESLTLAYSLLWKFLSFLVFFIEPCFKWFKRLKPIQVQLSHRPKVPGLAQELLSKRQQHSHCVVFFCSSAGEFEQAKPVIDRLLGNPRGDLLVVVFFYSSSGLNFALSRKEPPKPQLYLTLAPLTDSLWDWGWLFAVMRPSMTTVIRHEVWPGFLTTAAAYCPVTLIDASVQKQKSWMGVVLKKRLYSVFSRIYCLSDQDKNYLISRYDVPPQKILVTGDTKYDRVAERRQGNHQAFQTWVQKLKPYLGSFPETKTLVAGSVYPDDVILLANGYLQLCQDPDPDQHSWTLVLVPHKVDQPSIQQIMERCLEHGLKPIRTSLILSESESESLIQSQTLPRTPWVIIVDQMGYLAEIYGIGCAAYVGGALHHQVHNVLEPAIRGLSLAWGPHYTNSQEAEFLVSLNLAQIVDSKESLLQWWRALDSHRLKQNHDQLLLAVSSMFGATERVLKDWQQVVPLLKD